MYVWNFARQLHGWRHHIHTFLGITNAQENMTEQDQRTRGQPIQVFRVGHF